MLLPRLISPSTRLIIKGLGRRFFHSTLPRNKHPTHHGNLLPPVNCFMGSDLNQYIEPSCKVAVVIEGGTHLGYAVANELLSQYAETVVITSGDCASGEKATERLNAEHGFEKAHFIHADPSCSSNLEEVFKETFATFGRADIVFNNPRKLNDDSWEHDLNTNLTNIFRGTVCALKHMSQGGKKTEGGIIINNGTLAGIQPVASLPAHTAAQHGVVGATRCFGDPATYQKTGVRVVGLLCEMFVPEEDPCPPHRRKAKPEPQHPEAKSVGMASVHLVRRASTGTIWIVKDGQLHLKEFPSPFGHSTPVQKYV